MLFDPPSVPRSTACSVVQTMAWDEPSRRLEDPATRPFFVMKKGWLKLPPGSVPRSVTVYCVGECRPCGAFCAAAVRGTASAASNHDERDNTHWNFMWPPKFYPRCMRPIFELISLLSK